jgi:hypothetical protein
MEPLAYYAPGRKKANAMPIGSTASEGISAMNFVATHSSSAMSL